MQSMPRIDTYDLRPGGVKRFPGSRRITDLGFRAWLLLLMIHFLLKATDRGVAFPAEASQAGCNRV